MNDFGTLLETKTMRWTDLNGNGYFIYIDYSDVTTTVEDNRTLYNVNVRFRNMGPYLPFYTITMPTYTDAITAAQCFAGVNVAALGFAHRLDAVNLDNYGFPRFPSNGPPGPPLMFGQHKCPCEGK